MMKKIPLLILFISLAVALSGQTKKAFRAAAEKAYAENNYYAALTYYNEVLEFDSKDKEALLRSATAARKFNAYDIAVKKYTFLLDSLGDSSDSSAIFHAAEMFQRVGQYDKATEYFDRYITEYGSDEDPLTKKAKANKEASVWASSKIKEIDELTTVERLASDVNSNYSDFGAFQIEDTVYYSSMRFLEEDPQQKPARQYSKLLAQKGEDSSTPIESDFNKLNKSIANACYNASKTKLIYTICDYISETELRCDLYSSVVRPDGSFSDQTKLPDVINDSTYTTTQPSMVLDEASGNEILYFSSDRPGGAGGLDIWYSIFDKKLGFSKPINLSSINTDQNEVTPFFHEPTSTLYFSSDGRLGLGGYDIFQSKFNGGIYNDPVMISAPTNSSYHDMYYNLGEDGREALFSSNREGASYIDSKLKACCFDVYQAEIDPLEMDLIALTYNKLTSEELHGATVYLINADNGKQIDVITVDTSHEHIFKIEREKNYLIVGSKRGFLPDSVSLSTVGIKKAEPITEKLYLAPDGIVLDAFTFDADTKLPLNGVKIILEDLSDPTNDQIIKINTDNNDFHYLLEKDKTYKISAEKNGYSVATEIIDTRGMTGLITKKLYLNPFNLGAYLPIALFFDNDEPDPDSKSTATDKVFGDLLNEYMGRKKKFMEKYGQGAKGSTAQISIDRMEDFFEGDVRGGYDQFKIFMDGLIQELKTGKRIDMTIRGYASPRFDVKYNLVLAQRRISSVRNDMELYKGGVLAPYLASKQLIITEISYGEELSPPEVSDNLSDERESIYSLIASKQRRVEVVSVISK